MPVHQLGGSILVIVGRSARAAAVRKNKSDANTVDRTGRQLFLIFKVLDRLACTRPRHLRWICDCEHESPHSYREAAAHTISSGSTLLHFVISG
jgi:hypothetical protein